jgi:nucleoside-diphosphate-sugar epimerase
MSNYLVTGCAGFIASQVTRLLLDQGHHVTGLDDLSDGYDPRLKHWRLKQFQDEETFRFSQTDLRDLSSLAKQFDGDFDAVINLGARAGVRQSVENPWIYAETNYTGTLNLLELCKEFGVKKFVLASTSSVYGNDTKSPFSEDAATSKPLSPYASSKKAAETLVYSYHYLHGIDSTVFRFFTVYGPAGRPDMSIFKFTKAIVEDQPLTLFGDGGSRDFTHVDDIARGVVAGIRPVGYEIINLGSDHPVRTTHVISLIEKHLGKTAKVIVEDRPSVDVDSTWADITKAGSILDWKPEMSLEDGVASAVDWYLENREWAKDLLE